MNYNNEFREFRMPIFQSLTARFMSYVRRKAAGRSSIGAGGLFLINNASEDGANSESDLLAVQEHFLITPEDVGILFDAEWYVRMNRDLDLSEDDAFAHYLALGWKEFREPSIYFNGSWYLSYYKDLADAGINPLVHFVQYGSSEGRLANPVFDASWYLSSQGLGQSPTFAALQSYLMNGARESPSSVFEHFYQARETKGNSGRATFERLLAATQSWTREVSHASLYLLIAMYSPYHRTSAEQLESSELDGLIDFLEAGSSQEDIPGPFFNRPYYVQALRNAGLGEIIAVSAVRHFLDVGVRHRICPTPLFDSLWYAKKYPDVEEDHIWGFEHFLRWGLFEGRLANAAPLPVWPISLFSGGGLPGVERWRRFIVASSLGSATPGSSPYEPFAALRDALRSEDFQKLWAQTNELEPAIGDITEIETLLIPPFHDVRDQARSELIRRLPQLSYDTLVCVPWIRNGGADLVACKLSEALAEVRPDERVLILRTDQPHFDRPDWVPSGVDVVDASDLFGALPTVAAQLLLYVLITGLGLARVINVNSRLCWETLARFAGRLHSNVHLYAYLFCWDHTEKGHRVGYPSQFFPETIHNLDALFTDTVYLKNELAKIYRPTEQTLDKIIPLFSPVSKVEPGLSAASLSVANASTRPRQRILWAGRLDRQKRFDLVLSIALLMPEVDFVCWGKAVLDESPNITAKPENLVLNDGFASYDELGLDSADCWLFTSAWEGLPTILIELGQRGVPIVASDVGGVSELVGAETGWLVADANDPDAYVVALRYALSNPEARVERAQALRQRVRMQHDAARFKASLGFIIEKESSR